MSVKVNSRRVLHKGKIYDLIRENITLNNGVTTDVDMIRHPGATAIVPILGKNEVIMIKQYRHSIGDYILEIPAGTCEPGEAPVLCAKRELTEETGYAADSLEKLGEIVTVPGYSDERIHIFLATDLKKDIQKLDEDEIIEVIHVPFDKVIEMIRGGHIQDSKTISGVFLASHKLIN